MSTERNAEPPRAASLKKNAAYVYVGHFLKYLSPLILVPFYARVLGPDGYGRVLAALSLMVMVNVTVSYGFVYSGIRELASSHSDEDRAAVLARQLSGRLIMCLPAALIGIVGTILSPTLIENPWYGIWATCLGIVSAFSLSWFFQGIKSFKTAVLLDALVYPFSITFVLLTVRGPQDGVWALASLFAASALTFGASYWLTRRHAKIGFARLAEGWAEIKSTTVFFITSMSFTILTVGSTYILSTMASADAVGYYGTAEKFVSLAMGLLNPISQVLMPEITSLHKANSPRASALIKKGVGLEAGYGVVGLIGGALVAPFAIPLILGAKFEPSVALFSTMLCILPFAAVKHALILYVLIPMHEEKHYLRTSALNVVVNLLSALILVPLAGAMGMALARVISELTATIYLLVVMARLGLIRKVLGTAAQRA